MLVQRVSSCSICVWIVSVVEDFTEGSDAAFHLLKTPTDTQWRRNPRHFYRPEDQRCISHQTRRKHKAAMQNTLATTQNTLATTQNTLATPWQPHSNTPEKINLLATTQNTLATPRQPHSNTSEETTSWKPPRTP